MVKIINTKGKMIDLIIHIKLDTEQIFIKTMSMPDGVNGVLT